MYLFIFFYILKKIKKFSNFKIKIESVVIINKIYIIYFNVQKKIFYIKIIFSDWVTGTPVNFGGMTGRALAVILKLNFWKSCDQKKSVFFLAPALQLYGPPYIMQYTALGLLRNALKSSKKSSKKFSIAYFPYSTSLVENPIKIFQQPTL
jgi:hypothetical protein